MKLSNFEIFTEPFYYKNKVLVFPELWGYPEWDNICFKEKVKPYVISQLTGELYATDEFLQIIDMSFFNSIKNCNFLTIFNSIPENIPISYNSIVCPEDLYSEVMSNLVFLGWNPRCELGSAITDGLYPINVINTRISENSNLEVLTNKYGLIDDLKNCQYLCDLNNSWEKNEDFWYISGIYVDKYTFIKLNRTLNLGFKNSLIFHM